MKFIAALGALIFFNFTFVSSCLAAQLPGFLSNIKNYGNYDIQKLEFELRYDSHSGGDGTCSSCIHSKYKLKVEPNGLIHFPAIPLDSKNSRHSFELKVSSSYDNSGKQVVYFCDVLNDQFERCENVLMNDLKLLSAYSFNSSPMTISLASGSSIEDWIKEIRNMSFQVHVSTHKAQYGDELGWNIQVFGSCALIKCSIHDGAILFIGDLGQTPELFYETIAVENPKIESRIRGMDGVQFSSRWDGYLPAGLLNFDVDDK